MQNLQASGNKHQEFMRQYSTVWIFLAMVLSLGGCGARSSADYGDTQSSLPTTSAATAQALGGQIPLELRGLWDASEDHGTKGLDVAFFEIRADNTLVLHDYLGDSYDNDKNCYTQLTMTMSSEGGSHYGLTIQGLSDSAYWQEVTLIKVGDQLQMSFLDIDDEDGDGDISKTRDVVVMPRVETQSAVDFTRCI